MSLAWRSSDARGAGIGFPVELEYDLVFGDRIRQQDPVRSGAGVHGELQKKNDLWKRALLSLGEFYFRAHGL